MLAIENGTSSETGVGSSPKLWWRRFRDHDASPSYCGQGSVVMSVVLGTLCDVVQKPEREVEADQQPPSWDHSC
jgi:hypothetical protein